MQLQLTGILALRALASFCARKFICSRLIFFFFVACDGRIDHTNFTNCITSDIYLISTVQFLGSQVIYIVVFFRMIFRCNKQEMITARYKSVVIGQNFANSRIRDVTRDRMTQRGQEK